MLNKLAILNYIFAAILLFTAGYIWGIGQNLSCGHFTVKEILDKKEKSW